MFILKLDEILTLALNGSHSLYIDGLAWTITHTSTWIPLALLLIYVLIRNNDLMGVCITVGAIGLCILLADQMASSICKPLFERWRPANDPLLMYSVDVVNGYRGGRYGFFSSHAANTMAVATFVALLMRHRLLTYWLYSWALLNCWTRVYLGVHYVGDLLVGSAWGIFVGWLVWRLCKSHSTTLKARRTQFACRPDFTSGGYSIGTVHLFISGIALTYLAIAIKAFTFN